MCLLVGPMILIVNVNQIVSTKVSLETLIRHSVSTCVAQLQHKLPLWEDVLSLRCASSLPGHVNSKNNAIQSCWHGSLAISRVAVGLQSSERAISGRREVDMQRPCIDRMNGEEEDDDDDDEK